MTDLEKVKSLFNELDIEYSECNCDIQRMSCSHKDGAGLCIDLHAGTKNVDGYAGFVAGFKFTPDGKFIEVNIVE